MRRVIVLALLFTAACDGGGPSEPLIPQTGRLSGLVTIGPNCPVEQAGYPCPTQPSAYALRKIVVFDAARSRQLFTVDIDSLGAYLIDLAPADYVVDFRGVGIDSSSDVPKAVTIRRGLVTRLDIRIDTGIR